MTSASALPARVLIPLANPRTAADLVRLGAGLLRPGGQLIGVGIVEVPEGMPLSEGATKARQARRLLQRVFEFAPEGVELRTVVRIGRRAAEGIVELAAEDEADLIIFGWTGRPGGRRGTDAVFSPTIDEVVRDAPCNIAVVKQRGVKDVRRILTPVRGGPHAELALSYAAALGRYFEANVDVMHVVPPDVSTVVRAQAERALATFVRVNAGDPARPLLVEGANVAAAIVHEAETAQLVVMGAAAVARTDPPNVDGALFGVLPEQIAQNARPSVIVVKTRASIGRHIFEQRAEQAETLEAADRAAEQSRSIAARVDRWFAESNYHHSEYSDIGRLVALKQKQGITISAVLPTLNEADTIGPIVRTARRELVERFPLVDELVVIDSESSDDTREIAQAEGARVLVHSEILPRYGSYRGKGEALWKSLYATAGDLVAWCDTDIADWHPRFLYGTLGPLIADTSIGYVKAYYQRPIVEGGQLKEGGGGRVTELVARPLINLFFPELSGYIQPLAGEYAGRRVHLEQIPFFTGYAVEIGHLIDLAERLDLAGLGQVDLDIRVHRNQELEGLSKMSFVILQAVMKRLEERRKARLFAELGSSIKLPRSGPRRLSLEVIDLADQERPPMIRIPEYAERKAAIATPA